MRPPPLLLIEKKKFLVIKWNSPNSIITRPNLFHHYKSFLGHPLTNLGGRHVISSPDVISKAHWHRSNKTFARYLVTQVRCCWHNRSPPALLLNSPSIAGKPNFLEKMVFADKLLPFLSSCLFDQLGHQLIRRKIEKLRREFLVFDLSV